MRSNHYDPIKIFGIFLLISVFSFVLADRVKRPMKINKIKKMGLQIWTEMEPEWRTELMMNGDKPIFVAHTPAYVYPPSGMMWVNYSEVQLSEKDFFDVARSALKTAASNYGISKTSLVNLTVSPATYGVLKGFEVNFEGKLDRKKVDVRVFTGRAGDNGPITMQVYAPLGKIGHIKEQIRRSWSHTSYLAE